MQTQFSTDYMVHMTEDLRSFILRLNLKTTRKRSNDFSDLIVSVLVDDS